MELLTIIFNPGVLFFILGFIASVYKSDLQIPDQIVNFITLYLMLSIGFMGGISLYNSVFTINAFLIIFFVLFFSYVIPKYTFLLFKRYDTPENAAAIGACYGSNSTLTYISAAGFLSSMYIPYGGYMTLALVIMETPAIIYSLYLAQRTNALKGWALTKRIIKDGTLILLLGSLVVGYILKVVHGENTPLIAFITGDMFLGMLIFFYLYMGTKVGNNFSKILTLKPIYWLYASIAPFLHGSIGVGLSYFFGFALGDAFLFTILLASSSYIVAPAIFTYAMPKAQPFKYFTMSLGITFPLNILIGIPSYWYILNWIL